MKKYKIQKDNHFIGGGLNQFQHGDLYLSNYIIELFAQQESNIMWLNNTDTFQVNKVTRVGEYPVFQQFDLVYSALNVTVKIDTRIKEFSRFLFKQVENGKEKLTFPIVREDFIRPYYSPSIYMFVKVPWRFLKDNLVTNLGKADIQRYYKEMKGVDNTSFKSILTRVEEVDSKYPALISPTGKQAYPRWRSSMFLTTQHTVAKYGFGYPLLNTSLTSIFFDGTHRLTMCPVVEKDYPLLLNFNYQKLKTQEALYFISPPLFKNNSSVILRADLTTKQVGGWIKPVEETKKYSNSEQWNWSFPTHLWDRAFEPFIEKYLEEGFDFTFTQ